ncbi:MAG: alpha/beta hydrolase [Elusimicrobia bacterium]|nr:alpha/beta hydrolase [Elusimicrobiota bacterium]
MSLHARSNRITAGGVQVHVLSIGEGEPLLLLHGLGASSYSWRCLLPSLGEKFRVHALDWPGFGRSQQPMDFDYSVDGMKTWLGSFMDAMGIEKAYLAGNSMGGMAALAFASAHPERVARLALLGTPVYLENRPQLLWPLRWPVLGNLFELFLGPSAVRAIAKTAFVDQKKVTPDLVYEYSLALRTRAGKHAVAEFMRNAVPVDIEARVAAYRDLKVTTLVLVGDRDSMVGAASAQRFAKSLPRGRFALIPECGHAPQEEKPAEVLAALLKFFSP